MRLVPAVAFAGLLTNGCDRVTETQGTDLLGPIQLATAVTTEVPDPLQKLAWRRAIGGMPKPRHAVEPAAPSAASLTKPPTTPAPAASRDLPPAPLASAPALELALPTVTPGVIDPVEALAEPAAELVIPTPAPPLAAAVSGTPVADLAYVPQISDSVRLAYIAQVDAAPAGQRLAVRAGGEVLGAVAFQVDGGVVSVHVGQVLDLFESQMDQAQFAALRGSPAAHDFVSLERLQAAGIAITYNAAYDELVLDTEHG